MNCFNKMITVVVAGLVGTTSIASATIVMEWDFRTNQHLTVAGGTGATNAFLLGSVTVNTGPAVPVPPANSDQIESGYLNVPRSASTDPSGLMTSNIVGEWRDYFGREAFGTGSVYIVFRPHFSGSNNFNGPSGRLNIFNHKDFNFDDSLGLSIESESTNGPLFILGRSTFNQPLVQLPGVAWNSNSWYLVGGTWAAGSPIGVYLRELDTNKPAGMFALSGISLLEPTVPFKFNNSSIFVGRRAAATSPENANSDLALVRVLDNEYFSQAHFDSVYESLIIPEPSALTLVVLVTVAGTFARRWTR